MLISTYDELRDSVASWVQREDVRDVTDVFVSLVEADLNRRLRVRQMLVRLEALSADEQYEDLPGSSQFLQVERAVLSSVTPPKELSYLTPQEMTEKRRDFPGAGEPLYFSVTANQVEYLPTPSDTYTAEFTYYQKIPSLRENSTNWLLEDYPDIYLHGCLAHAFNWSMDEQRAAVHQQAYATAVDALESADDSNRVGSRPVMRSRQFGSQRARSYPHG